MLVHWQECCLMTHRTAVWESTTTLTLTRNPQITGSSDHFDDRSKEILFGLVSTWEARFGCERGVGRLIQGIICIEIKSRVRTFDSAAWNSISTIKHGISLALPLMKLPKFLSRFSFLRRTPLQHQQYRQCVVPEKYPFPPPPTPSSPTPTESNGNSEGSGVQTEAISERVGWWLLGVFVPGLRVRLVSY